MNFRIVIGIFLILHGLVHVWYVVLSQQLVEFKPDMGWTGESWLLGQVTWLATILYAAATVLFVTSGIAYLFAWPWARTTILISSILSALTIILFWDGNMQMIVHKGLAGLIIDGIIIAFVVR